MCGVGVFSTMIFWIAFGKLRFYNENIEKPQDLWVKNTPKITDYWLHDISVLPWKSVVATTKTSWWSQPSWKILIKLDDFPK